jgi:pyruvate,water dikinase
MMRAMGESLAGQGIIDKPFDIFYLTIEEIYGIHQGTLCGTKLKDIIELRKVEYKAYEDAETDPRFLTRGTVYWNNSFVKEAAPAAAPEGDFDLYGLPCCPGTIEGVVKVVKDPRDDMTLNGEILVTSRTDPGWVPLYPSISGLLVERGSLLSHSAIVAREMGLPAIVGIDGLTKKLKSGMKIRMDGKTGTIKILE